MQFDWSTRNTSFDSWTCTNSVWLNECDRDKNYYQANCRRNSIWFTSSLGTVYATVSQWVFQCVWRVVRTARELKRAGLWLSRTAWLRFVAINAKTIVADTSSVSNVCEDHPKRSWCSEFEQRLFVLEEKKNHSNRVREKPILCQ